MKLELTFDAKEFIDILKKMAIPQGNQKKGFACSVIFPKLIPYWENEKYINSIFEWIALTESGSLNIWVKVELKDYIEFKEPIRIPIDVKNILYVLADFKNSKNITFIHDDAEGIQTIMDENTTIDMPIIGDEFDEYTIFDAYPGHLDENEVVIFSNGDLKPNIQGSCDIEFLKNSVSCIKKYSSKNDNEIIYNFNVDEKNHLIESYTNKENIRKGNVFSKVCEDDSIIGSGELHYINDLSNVVDVLSGRIKFYACDRGGLWIMQDTEKIKVRYLIPPAEVEAITED
jgi:hypothetical protein